MNPDSLIIGQNEIALTGAVYEDEDAAFFPEGGFAPGQLRAALAQMSGDITLWINSPGGYVVAAEEMRVMLETHAGQVRAIVAGQASSAASMLIMGADRIEVSAGSFLMIHDPSGYVFGNAEDLRAEAGRLDVVANIYAGIYAARAGLTEAEAREIMRAETYYSAEAAVAAGFADAVYRATDDTPVPASMRATMSRDDAMASVAALRAAAGIRRRSQVSPEATSGLANQAVMAAEGGSAMDPEENVADTATPEVQAAVPAPTEAAQPAPTTPVMTADAAVTAERERTRRITMAARPHIMSGALDPAAVDQLVESGASFEAASAQMLEALGAAQAPIQMASPQRAAATIGRDERQTRREGLTMALTARLSGAEPEDDRARPYMVMSVHEMAAAAMGRGAPGFGTVASREALLMDAFHTTSDFPNVLSNSINRVLERQYELVGRTFTRLSREMTFNDFRVHDVVRPDEFPTLTKINETGEIKFGTMGDSKETVVLASYGTGVSISRQAMVNDDLGAIQDVIDNASAIVPEFEEATFWAYFNANNNLADGTAMFASGRNNLAGSGTAITVAAISAGRKALREMKAADGVRNVSMNAPSILLVGPAKETEAEQFVNQTIQPTKAADTNPFAGRLRAEVTETITDNAWYLLVDPARRTCNMRHGYLRERSVPRFRVAEPFGVQGVKMTLEHDFGVGGVNFRGGYKNPGA